MDLQLYLQEKRNYINSVLDKILPPETTYPESIHKAMRYSVFAGGKRLRPILTIAAAEACGGSADNVIEAACALELIHTYTLIHDDLPAMDDDDYRRGKLTCHKVFGEAIAILAGDALLTYAFQILARASLENKVNNNINLENILYIAKSVGSQGLIGGQVVDLESENKSLNEDILNYIHKNKTAALFKAAIKTGGVVAGANEEMLAALDDYAQFYGLAFQITDDILDIEGDSKEIGKSVGSDEKNNKLTYPSLYGIEKSKTMAEDNINKAIESLAIFGTKAEALCEIAKYTLKRTS
ncbi:MAG: geranylgeranyl diphosphate synthase, type [Clostridia bacterium]|jgi:geranylgeranyl diphosphate synthase type II|nr:geranylgeranyl diphosphate synthase, type [Clostridia bacterium]